MMIYRPNTAWEEVNAGLWWSDNPYEESGPENPSKFMDLDRLKAKPLEQRTFDFIERFWAVADGKIDEIGDVFQDFASREIVISQRVADIIRQFEPDLHDIVQIPRMWSLGSQQRIERPYFFINVHATARTVDMERSKVTQTRVKKTGEEIVTLGTVQPKENVFVYAEASDNRHLWRDDLTLATFMSQALVEALKAASVRGFDFKECTVITH
jgi:hypothetical protein